jgi:Uma2 family endonuclease
MATDPLKLTIDEYLFVEQRCMIKHEYIDGQLRAMTPPSPRHQLLVAKLHAHARSAAAADGRRCLVFAAGMQVRIEIGNYMYYPDVVGRCPMDDDGEPFLSLPCFVIEVLSPSTQRIDRREKLNAYLAVPSIEQYAIVEQDRMRIEVYQRDRGPWNPDVLDMPNDVLELPCIGLRVSLNDIYEGVRLPPLEVREAEVELPAYAEDED